MEQALQHHAGGSAKVDANYANKLEVERHKRWAYPVACIAPDPLQCCRWLPAFEGCTGRRGSCWPLPCSFVYYSLMSLGFSTGESGPSPLQGCGSRTSCSYASASTAMADGA